MFYCGLASCQIFWTLRYLYSLQKKLDNIVFRCLQWSGRGSLNTNPFILKKEWHKACLQLGLFFWFFCKQELIKSMACLDTNPGNVGLVVIIFFSSIRLAIFWFFTPLGGENGALPISNSYIKIPIVQTSSFSVCPNPVRFWNLKNSYPFPWSFPVQGNQESRKKSSLLYPTEYYSIRSPLAWDLY